MHSLLCVFLFACGSAADGPIRSVPTQPTVELKTELPSGITWTTAPGLFAPGAPAFPPVLSELKLGMAEADARAALDRVKHGSLRPPEDETHAGVTLVSRRLAAFETVGVTLLIRDGVLWQLDLSIPKDEAMYLVSEAWGLPTAQVAGATGVPQPLWSADGMVVQLIEGDGKQGVVKYGTEGR